MSERKASVRVLSFLLVLCMVVGLMPMNVFAADATVLDAAIFCSDLHGESDNLVSILGQVKDSGVTYSSVGLVGDTCMTVSDVTSDISGALGYEPKVMFSYAESHDTENGSDISTNWNYSGEVENVSDYYLVYTIRETDMQNASDANTAAPAFTTWYNGLTAAQKALPIFIMSHRPLHDRRDDNAGAATWYSAISAAAESSDIVFFWGHNHTGDNSVDQAAYYVAKDGDETMTIYNGSTVTPNFTYMNAGYIDANGQTPARKPVATTVQITADNLIFQDYTTSGMYTNSNYSHNVTVEREFAVQEPTLTGLTVSGQESYYAGDAFVAPTVTAVYSDTSKNTVLTAEEYEVSGTYDMNTAGTYTLTYTYEDYSAQYTFKVENVYISSIAVTTQPTKLAYLIGEELDTTGMVVTATYNNGTTAELAARTEETAGYYLSTVDMTTAGEKTVTVNYLDGNTTLTTTFTINVEEGVAEGVTLTGIEITKNPDKTEYLIHESLNLDGMIVVATFSDGSTVELDYKPFSNSTVYGGYDLYNFSMYVEKAHELAVVYTFGDVTCYDTTTINVWDEDFTDENTDVKVHVADGDYGVTAVNVAPSANSYVASALRDYMKQGAMVAYDITLTLDADQTEDGEAVYTLTEGEKTVTLPIPEGVTNPVVYYVSDDGATVTNMNAVKNDDGTVTFKTTHFSTYVIGDSAEITVPENETATGSDTVTTTTKKTVYVLTSSISAGNSYLIVNGNAAGSYYALANNSGSVAATGVTVTTDDSIGTYIELADADDELWAVGDGYTFRNDDDYYLGYTTSGNYWNPTYTFGLSTTARNWTYNNNNNNRLSTSVESYWDSTTYYLRYNNNSWTWTSSSNASGRSVYFYVPTEIEVDTTVTVSGTYSLEGEDLSAAVSEGSTGDLTSNLIFTPTSGDVTKTDVSTAATYEVVTVDAKGNTVDGDPNDIISNKIENGVVTFTGNYGTALVKVSYTTSFGVVTDYITVEAKAPYYSLNLHKAELTKVDITEFAEGVTYYTLDSTTNTYSVATEYVAGTTYYTTPVHAGDEITAPVALKGIEAGDTYAVWAIIKEHNSQYPDGYDLGNVDDERLSWSVSNNEIASVDPATGIITFSGVAYGTFDVIAVYKDENGNVLCQDRITISVTESLYVVPGDGTNDFPEYPDEGAVRFDKNAVAVGNFSETGIAQVELSMSGVPYTTGNAIDALLVLDMSTSMKTEVATDVTRYDVTGAATKAFIKTIVQNDDGSYNKNTVAIQYFNGTTSYTITDYVTVTSDAELEALNDKIDALMADPPGTSGTDYSTSMKTAYDTIIARDAVSDNTQALVFMSDGGPTYYTYVDGTSYGTVSNNAATIVGWFDTDDNDTSSDETDDTATPNSSFKTEYYSYLLKQAGYPVYTVGLGLSNNDTGPSAFTKLTSGAHEAITSYILSQMATNNSYFYNVADTDAVANLGNIFSAIAASIKEAAKDVVVEDKIGNDYTVNFGLPDGVAAEATGMSEFYIQVVEYVLDATTHNRTGVYTVLENFTFNADGTLKSHTVDGADCSGCAHVTTDSDGVITNIQGTYFNYEVGADGEYLHWTADKLSTTELALQYFVYLDDSAGMSADSQVDPGTYHTNEYATLTYTNYNGNKVQQEFPIPQMTWNGAQVSYVFYLVNAAGQPVNRAGRVVPFSEAVFISDTFTTSVVWHDLEQAAALEAGYLANDLLPDSFALYDDDAQYLIHVYEDEEEINLNNHFAIKGDVSDTYNTVDHAWTNANTTYVFNTKHDGTMYYTYGIYVANDGDNNNGNRAYFCKSYSLEPGATYETSYDAAGNVIHTVTSATYIPVEGETQAPASSMSSTTGGTVIDGYVYYVDDKGQVYTIVQKTDGNEVREGFDFSNTTVAFAVVWLPQLEEDTVVIDYGLDVLINVATNDGIAGGVVGVRKDAPANITMGSGTYTADKNTSVDVYIDTDNDGLKELKVGTAAVENMNEVRFSLDKTNGMQINAPIVFYYESDVSYYEPGKTTLTTTSMYSKVTVIPATTVYYEDEYVALKTWTDSGTYEEVSADAEFDYSEVYYTLNAETGVYEPAYITAFEADVTYYTKVYTATAGWDTNSVRATGTQDADRPGEDTISEDWDHNNPYGYDTAYTSMSEHSMNGAAMVNVSGTEYATAEFDFYGTGFDIISMTSNTTGTIFVEVINSAGVIAEEMLVDTYYGYTTEVHAIKYTYNAEDNTWTAVDLGTDTNTNAATAKPENPENGATYIAHETVWVVSTSANNSLWQVPVIKVSGLAYDKYHVTITASYNSFFDNTNAGNYDFYLDAIRIYDPANDGANDQIIEDAYVADKEGWPGYSMIRDRLVNQQSFVNTTEDSSLEGAVVFIDGNAASSSVADYSNYGPNNEVYLAAGQSIAFQLNLPDNVATAQLGIKSADGNPVTCDIKLYSNATSKYKVKSRTINTTTDMYYHIDEDLVDELTDLNGRVIVITNSGPSGIVSLTNLKFTHSSDPNGQASEQSDSAANSSSAKVLKSSFDVSSYIYVVPATITHTLEIMNAPEETVPDTTVPETTEPEETEPETTVPETTEPEETEPETTVPETTEPEETEPETTVPETTEPEETEPETFVPESLHMWVSKSTVKVGQNVFVTIITSTDVDALTVNGRAVENYVESSWLGIRTWILVVHASRKGELEISVVAYNADGEASEPVTEFVTVKSDNRGGNGTGKGKGRGNRNCVQSKIFG